MRILVVGAGIMGLCTAWALTRRGHTVTVLEQGPVPNPLGSSVDQHRLIRYPYGEEDGYVRMVAEAYGAWEELWNDLGQRLQVETGTLAFDCGQDDWAGSCRDSLSRCGLSFEILAGEEIGRRFPFLRVDGVAWGLYLDTGGVLLADRIVAALAGHLQRGGVEIRDHAAVAAFDADRAEVELAAGGRLAADALVLAAGPWGADLVPALAGRVTPSRQVVSYLEPPPAWADAWARAPMVLCIGAGSGFYAVPPVAGTGLKIGDHRFSLQGHPDGDREPAAHEAAAIAGLAAGRFRDFADYRLTEARTCFYDAERSERFVVEPLGARTWLLGGFSGHGFKFGAVIGQRLAKAMDGELDPAELTAWAAGQAERPVSQYRDLFQYLFRG